MAEETLSPISAAKPPVANPITPAGGGEAATLKLKPVLRKPAPGGSPALNLPTKPVVRAPIEPPAAAPAPKAADAPKALDQLKSVTQKLKGVTQEIPQQAILRKTGIISDQAMTEAQKQASKARTARISLSDAIGAAPVKEAAPMKTIRIKRPIDIPGAAPAKPAVAAPAPTPAPAEPPTSEAVTSAAPTMTQRKTLKVARPAGNKFAVKKPGSTAISKPSAPASAAGGEGDVADIADIPDMPPAAPSNVVSAYSAPAPAGEKDVPVALGVISLIVQAAACVAVGVLGYMLYTNTQTPMF